MKRVAAKAFWLPPSPRTRNERKVGLPSGNFTTRQSYGPSEDSLFNEIIHGRDGADAQKLDVQAEAPKADEPDQIPVSASVPQPDFQPQADRLIPSSPFLSGC